MDDRRAMENGFVDEIDEDDADDDLVDSVDLSHYKNILRNTLLCRGRGRGAVNTRKDNRQIDVKGDTQSS